MAERRMFSKVVIDSDGFMEMPLSTQALYFHLAMRADDDGFINNPKKIQRMTGASDDDFKLLIAKKFVITFESGVIVIKHWKLHNYIQKDRYKKTIFEEEKSVLSLDKNGVYTEWIQNGYKMDTQVRLGKDSIGKVNNNINNNINNKSLISYTSNSINRELILKDLVKVYEQNIAPISSIIFQAMDDWLNDVDDELIKFAIEEATLRNKRSWRYVEAILQDKLAKGIVTGVEARREKSEYESQKEGEGFENLGTHV